MAHVVFMDESGFATDWVKSIDDQPYYVLSSVIVELDDVPESYSRLRNTIGELGLDLEAAELGRGEEIKGSAIARGSGWWRNHDSERNGVRDAYLAYPAVNGGSAIVVVVDKHKHLEKYYRPEDPALLSFRFALERIQRVLEEKDDHALLVYDQNNRIEDPLYETSATLVRDGSSITYFSGFFGDEVEYTYQLDRILELTLCNSKNSLGLQVADFFATFAYQFYKCGQPSCCGWWDTLKASLHRKNGEDLGYGLKEFP